MLGTILVTSSYKWRSDKIISEEIRKCTNHWNLGYLRRLSCPPHVKMKYLKKKKSCMYCMSNICLLHSVIHSLLAGTVHFVHYC